MNLLADESVDGVVVDRLRADGHAVLYVAEMDPGIDDDTVLQQAMRNGALLLTGDRDFGELVFRLQRVHAGVLLIRLAGLPAEAKGGTVSRLLAERGDEMRSAFSVISPGRVRIRRSVISTQSQSS